MFLRQRGARYLIGTPKDQLRDFEALLLEKVGWSEVQNGLEFRLIWSQGGSLLRYEIPWLGLTSVIPGVFLDIRREEAT